jgi:hypothetical protein
MIRTWSLLLRTAHRRGYIVAGRFDATALVESPYLMHPIEHKTAGQQGHNDLLRALLHSKAAACCCWSRVCDLDCKAAGGWAQANLLH